MSTTYRFLSLSIVVATIIGATIDFILSGEDTPSSSEATTSPLRFLVLNFTYAEFMAELS
jgi:hypothetical protein